MVSSTSLKSIFQVVQLEGVEDDVLKKDRERMIDGGIKYLNDIFGNNTE